METDCQTCNYTQLRMNGLGGSYSQILINGRPVFSPLMGLFGTVVGMIEIFGSQAPTGSNPVQLAHGISVALYNTGFGLLIAIPSMIFWRHFRAQVNSFVIDMQQQAVRLVEVLHGDRKA